MSKFQLGMSVQNKAGEKATVVAGADIARVYMNFATGENKDYSISTATRNYKIVQPENEKEIAISNLEEENKMTNENILLEEENENAGAVIENNNEKEFEPTEEEEKQVEKENNDMANLIAASQKVNKKEKFEVMVATIIEKMVADESMTNLKVRALANDYASVKVVKNFVDFTLTTKKMEVSVLNNPTLETILPVRVVKASYGWRLDTIITITEESQIDEILRIIKLSYLSEIAPSPADEAKAKAKAEKDAEKAKKLADKIATDKAKAEKIRNEIEANKAKELAEKALATK